MINDLIQSSVETWMVRGLDASALRQRVLTNNLANVETPNFKRSGVSFEEELKEALNQKRHISLTLTHHRHRSNVQLVNQVVPKINIDSSPTLRNDGNNVDIDSEMAKLAINSIQYSTLTQQLGSYYSRLRNVINEGRR